MSEGEGERELEQWLWFTWCYKCFEASDESIRRKNFSNWSIKKCFESFVLHQMNC